MAKGVFKRRQQKMGIMRIIAFILAMSMSWVNTGSLIHPPGHSHVHAHEITSAPYASYLIDTTTKVITPQSGDIYVSPTGRSNGSGAESDPMDIVTAIASIAAGNTIWVESGTYSLSNIITITSSNSGTSAAYKNISNIDGGTVVLDFSSLSTGDSNRGVRMDGHFWHWYGIGIFGAGDNGMLLSGSDNIIEMCQFFGNRDSGLQISRSSTSVTTREAAPSRNLIKNCSSYDNADASGENADGFAPKLTCGDGNVFDGCLAFNNADDGWDLYDKGELADGGMGIVHIQNSVAFRNGKNTQGQGSAGGDMNGFKLGGEGRAKAHVVVNCLAFENGAHGFTDNNNGGAITLISCTSSNNSRYVTTSAKSNFGMDRTKAANFTNLLTVNTSGSLGTDNFTGTMDHCVYYHNSGSLYYLVGDSIVISKGAKLGSTISAPNAADFVYVETFSSHLVDFHKYWRDADGTINMRGFLELASDSRFNNVGTDGSFIGAHLSDATIDAPPVTFLYGATDSTTVDYSFTYADGTTVIVGVEAGDYIKDNMPANTPDSNESGVKVSYMWEVNGATSFIERAYTPGITSAIFNASDLNTATYTSPFVVNDFFHVGAASGRQAVVAANVQSIDGFSFTKHMLFNQYGDNNITGGARNIAFTTNGVALITVYWCATSNSARELSLGDGESVIQTQTVSGQVPVKSVYEVDKAGTYVLFPSNSARIFYIAVEGNDTPVEQSCEHVPGVPVTTAATCEADGVVIVKCTLCEEILSETAILMLDHILSTIIIDATYELEGSETTSCSLCDYENVIILPRLGSPEIPAEKHILNVSTDITPATYTTSFDVHDYFTIGVNSKNAGVVAVNTQLIDGFSFTHHLLYNGTGALGEEGYRYISFTTSGVAAVTVYSKSGSASTRVLTLSDGISALGTQTIGTTIGKQEFVIEEAGTYYLYSNNSTQYFYISVESEGSSGEQLCVHVPGAPVTIDATCEADGSEIVTCTLCEDTLSEITILKLEHSYKSVVTDPTCENQGYTTETCENCSDHFVKDYIEALGHSYDDGVYTPAQDGESGFTTYSCIRLDFSYDVVDQAPKLSSISLVEPIKTVYLIGEELDLKGLIVMAKYSNDSEVNVTDYIPSIVDGTVLETVGIITITVSYTEDEVTKFASFEVKVEEIPVVIESVVITVDNVRTTVNSNILVPVTLTNNPGVSAIAISFTIGDGLEWDYDPDLYNADDTTWPFIVGDLLEIPGFPNNKGNNAKLTASNLTLNFFNEGNNIYSNGVLLTLKLRAGDTVGEEPIDITIDTIINSQGTDLPYEEINGSVVINNVMYGDVNGDGKINIADYQRLVQWINGWDVDIDLLASDVNGDGKINIADYQRLVQWINGWDVNLGPSFSPFISSFIGAAFGISGFGADNMSFVIDTVTGEAGESVTVPIRIENNPGVSSISLKITLPEGLELDYDPSTYDRFPSTWPMIIGDILPMPSRPMNANISHKILTLHFSDEGNVYDDGLLVTLMVKITEDAKGSLPIELEIIDCYNALEDEMLYDIVPGGINIPHVHTPGAEATCTVVQTCTECGDEIKGVKDHNYASIVTLPACGVDGYTTFTCEYCDVSYIVEDEDSALEHDYVGEETKSATCDEVGEMTYTCEHCGNIYKEEIAKTAHSYASVVTPPTCGVDGYTTFTCEYCDDSYIVEDEGSALEHDYAEAITTPATCIATGSKTETCNVCGDIKTETLAINPANHVGDTSEQIITAATYEADGLMGIYCEDCHAKIDERVIAKLVCAVHDYADAVTTPATCIATGSKTETCSICGDVKTETLAINPANHVGDTYEQIITAATYAADGLMGIYCGDCNVQLSTYLIPQLICTEHNYTGEVTTAATCYTTGVRTFTCAICNISYTEDISVNSDSHSGNVYETPNLVDEDLVDIHCLDCDAYLFTKGVNCNYDFNNPDVVEATCITEGSKTYYCIDLDCHDYYISLIAINTDNHVGGTYKNLITEATHKADGVMGIYCEDCNELIRTEAIAKLICSDHDYSSEITRDATCTLTGITTYICEICDHSYTEEITKLDHTPGDEADCKNAQVCSVCGAELKKALGHKWDAGVITRQATTSLEGIRTFTCTVCSDTYTESIARLSGNDSGSGGYYGGGGGGSTTNGTTTETNNTGTNTSEVTPPTSGTGGTEDTDAIDSVNVTGSNTGGESSNDDNPVGGTDDDLKEFDELEVPLAELPRKLNPFSDVKEDDWYFADVMYAYETGLMFGTAADLFSPDAILTRGMIVTVLYRMVGSPDVAGFENIFNDIDEDAYYYHAVLWAAANELIVGYEDGSYDPNAIVTRQDLACIFIRYANFAGVTLPELRAYTGFEDDEAISDYARSSVEAFYMSEIIGGKPGNMFEPLSGATRAEFAAMLHRFFSMIDITNQKVA